MESVSTSRVVVAGVTGAVGQLVLAQLLAHGASVQCWTRRPLAPHVNCQALPLHQPFTAADVAICTLGTTLKQAGSQQAFYQVDFELILAFANTARTAGCRHFILLSSLGANAKQRQFYLRVKGEIEAAVQALGFAAVSIVRPSLLTGAPRADRRYAERAAELVTGWISPLIPPRVRPVSIHRVASFLLALAKPGTIGCTIYENWEIHRYHATPRADRL